MLHVDYRLQFQELEMINIVYDLGRLVGLQH